MADVRHWLPAKTFLLAISNSGELQIYLALCGSQRLAVPLLLCPTARPITLDRYAM